MMALQNLGSPGEVRTGLQHLPSVYQFLQPACNLFSHFEAVGIRGWPINYKWNQNALLVML